LVLRRVAVGIQEQVLIAVVCSLQRRQGVDVNDRAAWNLHALRRLTHVHRQRSLEDDERLLLMRVAVTPALGARFVAPDVPTGVSEPRGIAELGDVPCRLARFVWA